MFQDLDATLEQMLNDPAMPASLSDLLNAGVSFETPDRNFAPAQNTVNLFLYDVKENRELRDSEPITQMTGGVFTHRRPPIRVDCTYLATAWSNAVGSNKVIDEHRLLAEALLWLSRFTTIPPIYLQGSLATQPYPPPSIVAQDDPSHNSGEYWSALGIPPRTAFYVTVTIAMDLDVEVQDIQVSTVIAWYQQDTDQASRTEWITIGGTLVDALGSAVNEAWVTLAQGVNQAPLQTRTTAEGRFIFMRTRRGTGYTLRASKPGAGEVARTIDVPSPSGEYNLQLP